MPPNTDAPMHEEPITECGSRPIGLSSRSSWSSVAPVATRGLLVGQDIFLTHDSFQFGDEFPPTIFRKKLRAARTLGNCGHGNLDE